MGILKGTGSEVINLWSGTQTSCHGEPNIASHCVIIIIALLFAKGRL
jgi:hypothetical protein